MYIFHYQVALIFAILSAIKRDKLTKLTINNIQYSQLCTMANEIHKNNAALCPVAALCPEFIKKLHSYKYQNALIKLSVSTNFEKMLCGLAKFLNCQTKNCTLGTSLEERRPDWVILALLLPWSNVMVDKNLRRQPNFFKQTYFTKK